MSLGILEGESVFTRAFKLDDAVTELKRGLFVKMNNAGKLVLAGAGDSPLGIAMEDYSKAGGQIPNQVWPSRGAISVRLMGSAYVEAGGAVPAGSAVEVDANGKAIVAASTSTNPVAGMALSGAAAAGDFIEVLIKH